ncbi:MAG: serine acetyltransferase [Eubacteriaceae bacterium]|nr:serine acetyltransferase [Eubacteriaceae bacterium]
MKEIHKADLYRYDKEQSFLKGYWKNCGFRYTYFLRLASESRGIKYILYKLILKRMTIKYGYEISDKTEIGKGLAIMHLGGVAINHLAKIGSNCTIYQGVTIGGDVGKKRGAPVIGNKVWMGPNAVLVGKITIGNNVLIAGNAYVNFDVPDNSIVLGNPGVIKSWDRIDEYIEHTLEELTW